jgi:ankyrin repeat protein
MMASLENKIDYHSFALKNEFDIILLKIRDNKLLINSADNYGNTFLHYALINKNIGAIVSLVINSGINLNCKNNLGDTPLHIACYNVLNALLNQDKNIYYYFEIIMLLLNNGAQKFILNEKLFLPFDFLKDINNIVDSDGNTLLHILIKNCKLHIARFMIEYLNFDLNIQNNKGETPIHLSVFNAIKNFDNMEFYYFLNFLYKVGYNEYIKDVSGFTAGHYLENIFV